MRLSDYDYELPPDLIAQYPAEERDLSRMILLDKRSGEVRETRFRNFPRYLREGDILVVNDSRVVPARLIGRKETGGEVEVFLARRVGRGRWRALCRPSRRLSPKDRVLIGDSGRAVTLVEDHGGGEWTVELPGDVEEAGFIARYGHMPLPPYIRREDEELDRHRYQTVFARTEGSVAAPTAGLHFTEKTLLDVRRRGVSVMPVTLHVGPGTFRPLEKEPVEENVLSSEYMMMRKDHLEEVRSAAAAGRRVIAVGTTVTRALESTVPGRVEGLSVKEVQGEKYLAGWTDLFIYPGFEFEVVDSLLTNMHLPRSSLLVLVSAFAGREKVMSAYRWAVTRRFRFYSYGDVMFIR